MGVCGAMTSFTIPELRLRCRAALQWLLNSGVQDRSGAVHRYLVPAGKPGSLSAELTGYYIGALALVADQDPSAEVAAMCAAKWLQEQWSDGPLGFEPGSTDEYYFDIGMVARCLRQFARLHPEFCPLALRCSQALGRFDGEAVLPARPPRDWWSQQFAGHQAKAAAAQMWNGDHSAAYDAAIQIPVRFPDSSHLPAAVDYVHPYCYWIEAMLARPHDHDLRHHIAVAAVQVRSHAGYFERSDCYAQIIRLRLQAAAAGQVPLSSFSESEMQALLEFQRLDGGFYFGRNGRHFAPYVNTCSTVFALQAMRMWIEHAEGYLVADWRNII